jgi:hypothetical protein
MNEITIHGNLTADPVLREGQSGKSAGRRGSSCSHAGTAAKLALPRNACVDTAAQARRPPCLRRPR